VRVHDGCYQCSQCGESLSIPRTEKPHVTIRGLSGEPNVRSVEFEGRVIHTCMIEPLILTQETRRQSAVLRERAEQIRTRAQQIRRDQAFLIVPRSE
jgi:hypothetical protein